MTAPPFVVARARWAAALYALAFAGTLALAFVVRYPSLFEPRWYGDEGIFAAIAQNMRNGRTLYAEAWDNKPPLIFITYAGIQAAFGSGVFALHLVTTVVVLATQAVVMAIAAALAGARRALVAGVLFALAMGTPIVEGNLAMTETFMILATSLAVLLYVAGERRRDPAPVAWYAAIGVLIGVAANYKQVAVFDGAAVGVMVWLTHERPLRALAPIAAGFLAPHVAFGALFLATGALGEYWYAVAGSLGLYSEIGPSQGPLIRFAAYLPALLVVAFLLRRRQRGDDIGVQQFPMLWLGFAVAGVTSSSFWFPHYLQQAMPAAVLVLVTASVRDVRDDLSRAMLAVAGILALVLVFEQFSFAFQERSRQLDPVRYYRAYVSNRWGTMSDQDYDYYFDGKVLAVNDIARYIEEDGAGGTTFAWTEFAWLYPTADVTNPTPYYTSFLGEIVPDAKPEIINDLEADPPAYVVIAETTYAPFGELECFVDGRYTLLRAQGDWRLYRLSSAAGRLEPIKADRE